MRPSIPYLHFYKYVSHLSLVSLSTLNKTEQRPPTPLPLRSLPLRPEDSLPQPCFTSALWSLMLSRAVGCRSAYFLARMQMFLCYLLLLCVVYYCLFYMYFVSFLLFSV